MTINELITKAKKILSENKIEEAPLKARLLLSYMLGIKKEMITIKLEEELPQTMEENYIKAIYRLAKGYPLEYITGKKEFMKLEIEVTEDTLIPRADTEILVEEVLDISKGGENLLELCTGTGAIGIALAKYGDYNNITMTDISKKALQVAQENVKKLLNNQEKEKITLLESDMYENIQSKYDIIVANPPYIETEEIQNYDLKYEPIIALDGGEDGLTYYKRIIQEAPNYLTSNGILALEIGYNQAEKVTEIVKRTDFYESVRVKKDLNAKDRIVMASIKVS